MQRKLRMTCGIALKHAEPNVKIKRLLRGEVQSCGETAVITFESDSGTRTMEMNYETVERFILALQQLQPSMQAERAKAGKPPIAEALVKELSHVEFGIDQLNELAVLTAHYVDRSTHRLAIPRAQIAQVSEFVQRALQDFENLSKSRPQ